MLVWENLFITEIYKLTTCFIKKSLENNMRLVLLCAFHLVILIDLHSVGDMDVSGMQY